MSGKDEWEPIGFTYLEDDWLTLWVKVMYKLSNWNQELSGWSLEIGVNNIVSYLLIVFFIFRLFLGYYNSMLICLHYFKINLFFFKEYLYSFLSKFRNNK
jgi:hypothetical protein